MEKDLIYIFDKITKKRQELGEITNGFNLSLVIDGTKDSCKVELWSFSDKEIEPFTICWHKKNNTWWIVAHDKIERNLNENGTFIYEHTLNLIGAIELLNARDLTDCGFNQRRYTTEEFIRRLFALSNFEFQDTYLRINSLVGADFLSQKVDFIKAYENYSLLSAIRDFLDSYNMCAKLHFNTRTSGGETYLNRAFIDIYSKTGNQTLPTYQLSDFDDTRETKTMSKESFGTCVVSNAENVISTTPKTFPSLGSIKPSSSEYLIKPSNAIIRLPSNVFKGISLKIVNSHAPVNLSATIGGEEIGERISINPTDKASLEKGIDNFVDMIYNACVAAYPDNPGRFFTPFYQALQNEIEIIKENIVKASTITLYNGNSLNPINGEIVKGENVPYIPTVDFFSKNMVGGEIRPYIFCDEETKETLPRKWQGIAWKRGSNIISGFDGFDAISGSKNRIIIHNFINTDLQENTPNFIYFRYQDENGIVTLSTSSVANLINYVFQFGRTTENVGEISFIVNYIPMSDIKIKVDNKSTKKDIHLYNQNGKLTDNFALSKMINSYSKEISSDTITRYVWCKDFANVPKVGAFVITDNGNYVINNVSCNFTQMENTNIDFGYLIECEITMSKYVATKSLMVNPNTNIRDYGIPQNYNVKRKQLYRDYYELGYSLNEDNESTYYIDPSKIFNFGTNPNEQINLTAVICCVYDEEIGGNGDDVQASDTWYYQLETTTYYMNKMVYVMLDFGDNNIIGYANQNVYSGFKIDRVFSGQYDNLNTPISYVDSKGEVKHIYIRFADNEHLTAVYEYYQSTQTGGDSYEGSLYNYSCFIPAEIYNGLGQGDYTLGISESYYNKDAIEVPVFEYACQIDDSNEVLIGDNILTQHDNSIYFYHFIVGDNLTQENCFDSSHIQHDFDQYPYRYRMSSSARIDYYSIDADLKLLQVKLYNYTQYDADTNVWQEYVENNIQVNKDLAVFRHSYNTIIGEEIVELMFIAKKVPASAISPSGKELRITLNHYKLN